MSPLPCGVQSDIRLSAYAWGFGTPFSSSIIGIKCMPIRLKPSYLRLFLSMYSSELNSVILVPHYLVQPRLINQVTIRPPPLEFFS